MTEHQEILAYWLVPSDDDAARFQTVVGALADQQGAPRFRAHLSFGSVVGAEPELTDVLAELSGLALQPIEIEQTSEFTMSLFVRFRPSEQLLRARALFERCPGFQSSRSFDPHISLCYGDPEDVGVLKHELDALLAKPVRFDRLIATSIWMPVRTSADVARWRQRTVLQIPHSA